MFNFLNLDERTRTHMITEFEYDIARGSLNDSKRFTDSGREEYPALMLAAMNGGNETTLADALNRGACMVPKPHTAAQTFADGEFNRFYMRAVCLRAFDDGTNEVVVYRAKAPDNPRTQSAELIGRRFPANTLLDDLRVNVGVGTSLGLGAPNSGLSVYCACGECPAA